MALVLVARSQPVLGPWLPKALVPEFWLQLALVSPRELELLVLGPMGLVLTGPEQMEQGLPQKKLLEPELQLAQ